MKILFVNKFAKLQKYKKTGKTSEVNFKINCFHEK